MSETNPTAQAKPQPGNPHAGKGGVMPPKERQFGQPNGNPRNPGGWKREDTADIDKMSKTELKTALKTMLNGGVPTTVIDCEKPSRSEDHPTMKPVKLFAYLMRNSSRERERVLDTFAGSGTTIMAAEQLGRKAYCMELDPHYCDVIIKRWEQFTGRKAEKVEK